MSQNVAIKLFGNDTKEILHWILVVTRLIKKFVTKVNKNVFKIKVETHCGKYLIKSKLIWSTNHVFYYD